MQKHMARFYLAVVILVGSAVSQTPQPPVYRLPTTIRPLNYMLELQPDIEANIVSGIVMIEMQTSDESISSVTLHMGVNLTADKVLLLDANGLNVTLGSIKHDDINTLLIVELQDGSSLNPNAMYIISIQFTSPLYSEPNGLFIGQYDDTSKYIASYFRPTFARNAFPCFDEPWLKTPITLNVVMPANYNAVSTLPFISSKIAINITLNTFETNENISLHSLGLFISQISPVNDMGLNVYAPSSVTNISSTYLADLLQNLEKTIGSLPKPGGNFSLVILPDKIYTSFSSYGIVYVSQEVLYEESQIFSWKMFFLRMKLTLAFLQQYLEYQMTPQWWSDIWLSESIGTFVALTLQSEYYDPKFTPWIQVELRKKGFGQNINDCSQPVVDNQLLSRWDILDAINSESIKYKGLNVLTMWNNTMPEGLVMKTVQDYINLKKSVVTTSDFMEQMETNIKADTNYNVTATLNLLKFWLNTTGYPVLTYLPTNYSMFSLSQNQICPQSSINESVWPISVSYTQESSPNWTFYRQDIWLLSNTLNISQQLDQWIVFNLETAPYRVNYANSWNQTIEALKTNLVASNDTPNTIRAMLQEDATDLALAGYIEFSTMLSVLNNTQHNQSDWIPVAETFDAITAKIGNNSALQSAFRVYAESLFTEELLESIDLRNSANNKNFEFVRAVMTPWLCEFDFGTCRQAATQLFQNMLQQNITGIDVGDIENVACQGSRYNTSVVNQLLTAYKDNSNLWLRYLYTISLSCTKEQSGIVNILNEIIIPNSSFAVNDARNIMVGLASSWQNSAQVVNFIVEQSVLLQNRLGIEALSTTIRALAKFNVDLSKLNSLINITQELDPAVLQAVQWTLKAADDTSMWWQKYGTALEEALNALPNNGSTTSPPGHSSITPPFTTTNRPPTSLGISVLNCHVSAHLFTAALSAIIIIIY